MTQKQQHVVLSHADDLDGVASAILISFFIKHKYNVSPKVCFVHYDNVDEVLTQEVDDATHLWIADLSIRNKNLHNVLTKFQSDTLFFFDHHTDTKEFVDLLGNQATVRFNDDGTQCAADLIWDYIQSEFKSHDSSFVESLQQLVNATHSRDLWINDVVEGATLSAVIAVLGPDKSYDHLMEDISRSYTQCFSDLMNLCVQVVDDNIKKATSIATATTCKYFYLPDNPKSSAAGLTVYTAFTCGYQSEVGNSFLEKNNRAIVALINLEKGTLSFRTNSEVIQALGFGVNEIAKTIDVSGGGHPFAAGAKAANDILFGGPKKLLSVITKIIDAKMFEKEGIATR